MSDPWPPAGAPAPPPAPRGFGQVPAGPTPPSRSPWPIVLGLGAVGLLLAAGAWWALGGLGGPAATATPTAAAIASPTAVASSTPGGTAAPTGGETTEPSPSGVTPTSGPGGPDASLDPATAEAIRAVMEQVPPIRGLEPLAEVPFRIIGTARLEQELREQFSEDNPPEQLLGEQRLYQRLGLLPEDADLEELVLTLLTSQVAGFYDPRTGAFTIIAGDDFAFGALEKVFTAHEYTHALQDQHYDLEGTRVSDPSQGDRGLAELGLIEGDASAVMFDWAFANLELDELLALGDAVSPQDQELLESMPLVLRRQLEFPYLDGLVFAQQVRQAGGGTYAAIDAAWADRPVSTEQIMHPETYLAGEEPIVLELPDLAGTLGAGWETSHTQTLGELFTGVFVAGGETGAPAVPGLPPLPANAEAAAGWGGDRAVQLDHPDGRWVLAWQTAWDSATDAGEFQAAAEAALADLPFATSVSAEAIVAQATEPVLVLVAGDEATLEALRGVLPEG